MLEMYNCRIRPTLKVCDKYEDIQARTVEKGDDRLRLVLDKLNP